MKRTRFLGLILVLAALPIAGAAQRMVKQTETLDYVLTVGTDSAATVNAWWKPFLQSASREGYCFDLPNMPLVDRPQLGDKAVVIKAGGVRSEEHTSEL